MTKANKRTKARTGRPKAPRRVNPALPRGAAAELEVERQRIEREEQAKAPACEARRAAVARRRVASECERERRARVRERVRGAREAIRARTPRKWERRAAGAARMTPAQHRQRREAADRSRESEELLIGQAESYVPERERDAFRAWARAIVRRRGWDPARYEALAERWAEEAPEGALAAYQDEHAGDFEREREEYAALYAIASDLVDVHDELRPYLEQPDERDAPHLRRELEALEPDFAAMFKKELAKMRKKKTPTKGKKYSKAPPVERRPNPPPAVRVGPKARALVLRALRRELKELQLTARSLERARERAFGRGPACAELHAAIVAVLSAVRRVELSIAALGGAS